MSTIEEYLNKEIEKHGLEKVMNLERSEEMSQEEIELQEKYYDEYCMYTRLDELRNNVKKGMELPIEELTSEIMVSIKMWVNEIHSANLHIISNNKADDRNKIDNIQNAVQNKTSKCFY